MTKDQAKQLIDAAQQEGRKTLSEYEAKQILAAYQIPVTREMLVQTADALPDAADQIGYPLVLKGCSAQIAHKTEKNLVHVDVRSEQEAQRIFKETMAAMDGDGAVLVQELIRGRRELVLGMTRDPQFGACVMFGLGGIFTEILKDISFRKAPITQRDALEMMREIKGHKILGAVRGMAEADTKALSDMLIAVGQIGVEIDAVAEIDLNPVILNGPQPVAVDALIVLG
jgi:acetyl-CoA synthetase (ADP-forming)